MTALGGRLGRPAAMSAAVASMESRNGPVGDRWPRRQRERQLVKRAAVLGFSFDDDDLGRCGRVVAVDDGDRAERPSLRVVGETRGRRRLVERVHRPAELAGCDASGEPDPPLRLARLRRRVPVGVDLGIVGDEDVGVVAPFVDRIVEPVEVGPPERLVLAAVVAARRRDHRHRSLFRAAGDGVVADELRQCAGQRIVVLDGHAVLDRLRRRRVAPRSRWPGRSASPAAAASSVQS